MNVQLNIMVCHKCPRRRWAAQGSFLECEENGQPIVDNAQAGECPLKLFNLDAKELIMPIATIPLAGDVIEAIAKRIGADRLAKLWEKWTGQPCACAERKERLNRATARLMKFIARV